ARPRPTTPTSSRSPAEVGDGRDCWVAHPYQTPARLWLARCHHGRGQRDDAWTYCHPVCPPDEVRVSFGQRDAGPAEFRGFLGEKAALETTDPSDLHREAAPEADPLGAFSFPGAPPCLEDVAIDRLRPDPANPRRIEKDEVEALIRSIRQYGFVQPIVATRDRTVVAGHQRLIAARRLGHQTVPVIFVDLSTAAARTLGLALNKISGRWDEQLLANLIADLQDAPGLDLSLSGFGEDEITSLLRSLDAREKRDRPEAFDLDAALEAATTQPRTQPGDLWILGEHRLLARDATQAND